MAVNSGWDAIVFGEVVFPGGGVLVWAEQWFHRVSQLEQLDTGADDQLAQILITPVGVAVRCWFSKETFQEWCPRIEAMFSAAAKLGGSGDVTFVGVDGPAYRLVLEAGRATLNRIPAPGFEHPELQEIVLAVEQKAYRRAQTRAAAEMRAATVAELQAASDPEADLVTPALHPAPRSQDEADRKAG
jgi:hypothetical protein